MDRGQGSAQARSCRGAYDDLEIRPEGFEERNGRSKREPSRPSSNADERFTDCDGVSAGAVRHLKGNLAGCGMALSSFSCDDILEGVQKRRGGWRSLAGGGPSPYTVRSYLCAPGPEVGSFWAKCVTIQTSSADTQNIQRLSRALPSDV